MADTETKSHKPRKPREKVDPNESPRERWERLVRPRAQRLIDTAKLLGNLRGSVYDWDPKLERELFERFEAALEGLRKKWELDSDEGDKDHAEDKPASKREPVAASASNEDSDLEW